MPLGLLRASAEYAVIVCNMLGPNTVYVRFANHATMLSTLRGFPTVGKHHPCLLHTAVFTSDGLDTGTRRRSVRDCPGHFSPRADGLPQFDQGGSDGGHAVPGQMRCVCQINTNRTTLIPAVLSASQLMTRAARVRCKISPATPRTIAPREMYSSSR